MVEISAVHFEEIVGEALDEVPPELMDLLDNVSSSSRTSRHPRSRSCLDSTTGSR